MMQTVVPLRMHLHLYHVFIRFRKN